MGPRLYGVSHPGVPFQPQSSVKGVGKSGDGDPTHCKINRRYGHNPVVAFGPMWVEHLMVMVPGQQLVHNLQVGSLVEDSFVMLIMTDIADMMMQ